MLIRPLVSAFPDDRTAREAQYQYLFGPSLMVCPVLNPGIREMEVYLPRGTGWYDWHTSHRFEGGQWIRTETDPMHIIRMRATVMDMRRASTDWSK